MKPDSSSTAYSVFSIGVSRVTPRKSACDATARTSSSRVAALLAALASRSADGRPRGRDSARSRGHAAVPSAPRARRRRRSAARRRASPPRRRACDGAASRSPSTRRARFQASWREISGRPCRYLKHRATRSRIARPMEKFVIEGGVPLSGTVVPAGNKNGALPILAACLLTDDEVILRNVPRISDVDAMLGAARVARRERHAGPVPARSSSTPSGVDQHRRRPRARPSGSAPRSCLRARCSRASAAR